MSSVPSVDPSLGRIPRVLVPIEVDGLVLRAGQAGFADCRMADPDPAGGRQDLLPAPFTDLPASRPRGVYLHWALPDALTHGRPTQPPAADGTAPVADLPPVPDRWLVVRFALGVTPDHRRLRAWVLESGGPQPVVSDMASWHESGTRAAPGHELTALGPGDPAWAAYYDNVAGGSASTTRSTTAPAARSAISSAAGSPTAGSTRWPTRRSPPWLVSTPGWRTSAGPCRPGNWRRTSWPWRLEPLPAPQAARSRRWPSAAALW